MENASKALIIAGAILISILLISIGIMVFNAVSQPAEEAKNMGGALAAQTFNAQFEKYLGDTRSASDARAMIQIVEANNRTNESTITLTKPTSIVNNKTYKITATYEAKTNYILTITVAVNS